ncbi:hypothetical protein D3C87_405140 [compost metagenome]
MRKFLYIIILMSLTSCSAQKGEYDAINDFLEAELSEKLYDTIYIIENPIKRVEIIKLYEQAYNERLLNNEHPKGTWVTPSIADWPLGITEIEQFKKDLKDEKASKNWESNDFRNKNFIILPEKIIRNKDFIIKHVSVKNYVFNLSKPIFNKNKNVVMFQFYPSLMVGGVFFNNKGLILMKKENGKWVLVSSIREAVYY